MEREVYVDSFVFYRSFYEAIAEMPEEEQRGMFIAICEYALDGIETEGLDSIQRMAFKLCAPVIDSNYKKRKNGMLGGRPTEEKPKVIKSKTGGFQEQEPAVTNKEKRRKKNQKPYGEGDVDVSVSEKEYVSENAEADADTHATISEETREWQKLKKEFPYYGARELLEVAKARGIMT